MKHQVVIEVAACELLGLYDHHEAHIGIGDNEIVVYVTKRGATKKIKAKMPAELFGYPVRVKYIGKVRPAAA
jgi:hypothetical protein